MSSFFRTGETSSSEYTETESSDDEQQQVNTKSSRNVRALAESSDDDDDGVRVVKSQKDKVFEACSVLCANIIKSLKVDEIAKAHEVFKQLVQLTVKANALFSKAGFPQSIIKTVASMLVLLKAVTPSSLDANNLKAMKELIMNIDKFKKAYPKQFDAGNKALASATQKSSLFAGSDEEDEDDDEDEELTDEDEELTTTDEEELTEEEVEEEEEENDDDIDLSKLQGKITRDFWVKKPSQLNQSNKSSSEIAKAEAEEKEKLRLLKLQQRQAAALSKKGDLIGEDGQVLTKMEKRRLEALKARSNETITAEAMGKKLREIVASRGKRSADIPAIINELIFLKEKAEDSTTVLRIQTLLTLFHFDHHVKSSGGMSLGAWKESAVQIAEILALLNKDKQVRLVEDDSIDDSAFSSIDFDKDVEQALNEGTSAEDVQAQKVWFAERKKALEQAKALAAQDREQAKQADANISYVEGNLFSYLYRLSNEYYVGLQGCDSQSATEYVNRIRELTKLLDLFEASYKYYIDISKPRMAKRVAELILSYIYYNYNEENDVLLHPEAEASASQTKVNHWAEIILTSDEPRSRIKALLYQLYSAAIHNRFSFAKERLSMSYLADTINELDIDTRVLYNRTITQMGLSAFRYGNFKAAVSYIGDLYRAHQSRPLELLAQGTASRPYDPSSSTKEDPDLVEAKKRIYPYHQHINLDYLEAAHLISAMIVEIPLIAEHGIASRRIFSKTFRRAYQSYLERYSAQNIIPSIDSTREALLAASHSIAQGSWKAGYDLILTEVSSLWTANPAQTPFIKAQLEHGIKITSLKSYLLTRSNVYVAVTLNTLVKMFELPEKSVQQIINQQVYQNALAASWDCAASPTDVDGNEQKVLEFSKFTNQPTLRIAQAFGEKLGVIAQTLEKIQAPLNKKY
jgi:translation initiation factor 3 subunit C